MPLTDIARIDQHERIARALADDGACLVRGFPTDDATDALREDLRRLHARGALRAAGIGRGNAHAHDPGVRGDATLWLDDPACGPAARDYLRALDALRAALDRALFLGIAETEAHYAWYPPGTGYARHRDRFRDSDARVVSVVSYLNADWHDDDGGALRLWRSERHDDVLPRGGTTVCFLSELEHEVLPAGRDRLSIAAWMRRRA